MLRRSSLQRNLIALAVGVLALYYALVLLFSVLFMEPYYLHNVEKSLIHAYHTIEAQDEYDLDTISTLESGNLSIIIADLETDTILYNSRIPDRFMPDMVGRVLPIIKDYAIASGTGYYVNSDELQQITSSGTTATSGKRVILGGVTDRYVLEISTSYASISQATTISLQFSLIVGLMVMLIAILAFSRMSSSMVGPITQITSIAKQIAHLDFSQKCEENMGGEIGDMARSVNIMSDFMQSYTQQLQDANRQLKEDIRQKQEAEEARKNLVSNLSHDLKTPIGLIAGYADGLRSGMVKDEAAVKEYCDVICDESDRMMTMILKMMELFRLESGTVELEPEEFDFYDLLHYEEEIFTIEFEKANIQFASDYPEGLYVTTDYFAAEQVVTNYMQNAITHISDGKELRLHARDTGDGVRVEVYNSSAPIPEEELSRLWDSFYRLDKSRKRSHRESGLGLSIVRSNMELLDGGYGVENRPGGVCFWAEFPKKPPERE